MTERNLHICTRCGEAYDPDEEDISEDATIYWVPTCPVCNADLTATTVSKTWLNIGGEHHTKFDRDEEHLDRLQVHARLYHGRLVGMDTAELIERAQYFDDRVSHGRRWGPQSDRDVAFALRRQARDQLKEKE